MKREIIEELVKLVGSEDVLASRRDLLAYEYDSTPELFSPEVVVFPSGAAETAAVMKLAQRNGLAVVPRGAGTNLSGGSLAIKGGIVLGFTRMDRVLEIDTADERVVVEPGVVNLDLQNALAPLGYLYAPDPASQKVSTLGGNVGENSGGPHCLKYGVTTNHVYGLEVVLPDGEVVHTGGVVEDNPGYDLTGLIVGSEGTLGTVTSMTLRLMRVPEAIKTMLAVFDTLEAAGSAVSDIIAEGIIPATLEIMDKTVTQAVEASSYAGYPLDSEGVLIIELDGLRDGQERLADRIAELCRKNRVREIRVAKSDAERSVLWAGRRGAFGAIARICQSYSVQDGTVPRTRLAETLRKVNEIADRHGVRVGSVAHAGDGNLHPLIMLDPRDPDQVERVRKAGKEMLKLCVEMGGTLTGEHGVGIEKQDSMRLLFGDAELSTMALIKKAFDPNEILNPGKILPPGVGGTALTPTISPGERGMWAQTPPPATPPRGEGSEEAVDTANPVRRCGLALSHQRTGRWLMADNGPEREAVRRRLAEIVGPSDVVGGETLAAFSAFGEIPVAVVRPANEREAVEVVALARDRHVPVVPWGGGSKQDVQPVQPRDGIVLQTTRLGSIVELDAPNLTVTVGAGMVVDDLQRELAKHALFLPLDPVDSDRSTIGGTLATNSSGPNRLLYRTARDFVLGLRVVTPRGEAIKAGGKTVKDVAGYDLKKLYIGSWGTLGLITEATFRLLPLPEARATVAMLFPDLAGAATCVSSLLSSFLRPAAVELLGSRAMHNPPLEALRPRDGEYLLLVQVEGAREVVDRHTADLPDLAMRAGARATETADGEPERSLWEQRKRLFSSAKEGNASVFLKASAPVKRLSDFIAALPRIPEEAEAELSVAAHAGNGIVYLLLETRLDAVAKLVPAVEQIQRVAQRASGFAMVQKAPPEISGRLVIWPRRDDYALMRAIRAQLDPNDLWNPARVPGGRV